MNVLPLYDPASCRLCPRACGKNRLSGVGFCGVGNTLKIARAALHLWEEPCISGKTGTGAVFFSGCPLRCSYCQNARISAGAFGKEIDGDRFVSILFELKAAGAVSIDLVTPMHFAPLIRDALLPVKSALGLPVVFNTGGFDSPEQLAFSNGVADIYMPDFKYPDAEGASNLSLAPSYPRVALDAIAEMIRQVGPPRFSPDGLLLSGVLVRHLILPGRRKQSIAALDALSARFSPDSFLLSVMSQFTPLPGAAPPLHRPVTSFEARSVEDHAAALGFNGFFQDRSSAKNEYIPPFDLTGV